MPQASPRCPGDEADAHVKIIEAISLLAGRGWGAGGRRPEGRSCPWAGNGQTRVVAGWVAQERATRHTNFHAKVIKRYNETGWLV